MIYMELKTSVIQISGSFYVLIPSAFVEYCKLKRMGKMDAKIEDIEPNKLGVTFPVW